MKYRNLITKISNLAVLAHIPFGHVPNRKGWKGKSLIKPSYLGDIKKTIQSLIKIFGRSKDKKVG